MFQENYFETGIQNTFSLVYVIPPKTDLGYNDNDNDNDNNHNNDNNNKHL